MLGRGREEECGNEVPCRGRGLGAGWQNGFERGATGLTVVQQTWQCVTVRKARRVKIWKMIERGREKEVRCKGHRPCSDDVSGRMWGDDWGNCSNAVSRDTLMLGVPSNPSGPRAKRRIFALSSCCIIRRGGVSGRSGGEREGDLGPG